MRCLPGGASPCIHPWHISPRRASGRTLTRTTSPPHICTVHLKRAPGRVAPPSIDQLEQLLARQLYVADRSLTVSVYLALQLRRPLFLEGEAGVGKTEIAKALAAALGTELIRLQCYEGIDVAQALYEWNYPRQLLEIRLLEASHALDRARATKELFSEAFLIKRPLLQALEQTGGRRPVLLIDEIDRADDEFEGFLLELLSDFQVTIPELGTIRAAVPPIVVLTSNRTREIHDALKRRCLYHWIPYPDFAKEYAIVTTRLPGVPARLAAAGDGVRAGAAAGRPAQAGRGVGDARLGGGAGRAQSGSARRDRS